MKQFLIYVALLTVFSCNSHSLESDTHLIKADGEYVYKKNCANCHKIDQDYTAPPFRIIFHQRSKEWVYLFLVKREEIKKDSIQEKLEAQFKNTCKLFPEISKEEVDAIYKYSCCGDP